MPPAVRRLFPVLLSAALGCAGGPPEIDRIPPGTPGYRMLSGRVSLPQGSHETTNCGPETLCAALNHLGIPVAISEVEREIYLPSIKGSVAPQIVDFARRKGAQAKVSEGGGLWKLRAHLDAGSPVMIEVTRRGLYHYFLVAGMSEADRAVVCAYYGDRQHLLTFELLVELWQPTRFRSITFSIPRAEEFDREGWDYLGGGKDHLAEERFLKALALDPQYGPSLGGLGRVSINRSRFEEAQGFLERALKSMPGDPRTLNDLAHTILTRKGDAARAEGLSADAVASKLRHLRDLEEELRVAPPGTGERIREDIADARFVLFYYYGTWGQALEASGKTMRSVEERERSFQYAPDEDPDGVARRHLETGLALRAIGSRERAAEHFRKGRAKAQSDELRKRFDEHDKAGSEPHGR